MTYQQWLAQVDAIIADRLDGMTSSDLADTVFTGDRFADGDTPLSVADDIMRGDDIGRMWLCMAKVEGGAS